MKIIGISILHSFNNWGSDGEDLEAGHWKKNPCFSVGLVEAKWPDALVKNSGLTLSSLEKLGIIRFVLAKSFYEVIFPLEIY